MPHDHQDSNVPNEVFRVMHIGLLCTQEIQSLRPTMSKALQMLTKKEEHLPAPTNPPFMDEGTMELNDTCEDPLYRFNAGISDSIATVGDSSFYPRWPYCYNLRQFFLSQVTVSGVTMAVFSEKPVLISCLYKWKKPQISDYNQASAACYCHLAANWRNSRSRCVTEGFNDNSPKFEFEEVYKYVCMYIYIYTDVSACMSNTGYSTLNRKVGGLFNCMRCKPDEAAKTAKTIYEQKRKVGLLLIQLFNITFQLSNHGNMKKFRASSLQFEYWSDFIYNGVLRSDKSIIQSCENNTTHELHLTSGY